MIAEIYHKISSSGSNLTDRLEDNLTGNFFGTMRYIPFNHGLKQILVDYVYPREIASKIMCIDAEYWNKNIKFWPRDQEGEIDVLMDFPEVTIGIEVKYLSGLSSDDDVRNDAIFDEDSVEQIQLESCQQLARESRIISRRAVGKEKILILIADEIDCSSIYQETISRNILATDVQLAVLSWQDIFVALKSLKAGSEFEQLILKDLNNLLFEKGFERFHNFSLGTEILVDKSLFFAFAYRQFSFDLHKYEICEGLYYEFK